MDRCPPRPLTFLFPSILSRESSYDYYVYYYYYRYDDYYGRKKIMKDVQSITLWKVSY